MFYRSLLVFYRSLLVFYRSLLVAAALVVSAPSFAQTGPTPQAPGTRGMETITTGTIPVKFVSVQPTDVVASKLMGLNVYSKQNESIGEIEDLVIDNGKDVRAVILSVGGFLGMGERYVAVSPSAITFIRSTDAGTLRAELDTTKDQISKAPTFKYSKRNPWARFARRKAAAFTIVSAASRPRPSPSGSASWAAPGMEGLQGKARRVAEKAGYKLSVVMDGKDERLIATK
jgi:sporulation protein YlmC with PRC-barrel domain